MATDSSTQEGVSNATANRKSTELLPSLVSERVVGTVGYFAMWIGMAVIIATFAFGEYVTEIKLPYVVGAIFLGNMVCGIFITLSGDIGVEHGLAFPVYLRVTFGPIDSIVPSMIRGLLACCWVGIQTYFGATAVSYIVAYFFGIDSWFACFVLFLAVQIANAAFGISAIDKFAMIAAPCILLISFYLIAQMMGIASANNIDVWNVVVVPGGEHLVTTEGASLFAFMSVCFANMSYWSTSAADTQSLTKYVKTPVGERNWFKRNLPCILAHLVALPATQTFVIMIGGLSLITLRNWNPIEALQTTASGITLLLFMVLIVFAQWSTNTAASILPGAMTFMNASRGRLSFPVAAVIVGILALVCMPWEIMARFGNFLNIMGSVYGPIAGINIADYYCLRRRRLNVPDLYRADGQFAGAGGWNFAGIIALLIGVVAGLVLGRIAFLGSLAVAGIAYYFLAKYWWFTKYHQAEIEANFDDKYLGISVGHEWVIDNPDKNTI